MIHQYMYVCISRYSTKKNAMTKSQTRVKVKFKFCLTISRNHKYLKVITYFFTPRLQKKKQSHLRIVKRIKNISRNRE